MKVASFNVNSIRARWPALERWLSAERPDVLALQETKVQDQDFPVADIERLGYVCAFSGQKSYNGVAILGRSDIEAVERGLLDEPKDEPRLISARIRGITVVNTYVPQGRSRDSEMFGYKLAWLRRLREYFDRKHEPADPVLWVGDLNVAPAPMDVYDPQVLEGHVCYCEEVRQALGEVMGWGLCDVFRRHNDKPRQFTFWDYRLRNSVRRNLGWRIDHIMATAPLAERSLASTIDLGPRLGERPSDHTPVVAQFAWP